MCGEYNGWPNYETWVMNLWNDNEQGIYEHLVEELKEMAKRAKENDEYSASDLTYELSKYMASYCEEVWLSEFETEHFNRSKGPIGDFVTSSWKMIDWYKIAEHLVADNLHEEAE